MEGAKYRRSRTPRVMGSGRPFWVVIIVASMGGVEVEVVANWSVGDDGFNVNTWSKRDQTTAFAVICR